MRRKIVDQSGGHPSQGQQQRQDDVDEGEVEEPRQGQAEASEMAKPGREPAHLRRPSSKAWGLSRRQGRRRDGRFGWQYRASTGRGFGYSLGAAIPREDPGPPFSDGVYFIYLLFYFRTVFGAAANLALVSYWQPPPSSRFTRISLWCISTRGGHLFTGKPKFPHQKKIHIQPLRAPLALFCRPP